MMKATELMIGDWVMHFGEIAQIAGIRNDLIGIAFKTNIHDTWYESGTDGIEPIPLTAEILEKNDFVPFDEDPTLYLIESKGIIYDRVRYLLEIRSYWKWGDECERPSFFIETRCKYVHLLQRYMRLCGYSSIADNFKI